MVTYEPSKGGAEFARSFDALYDAALASPTVGVNVTRWFGIAVENTIGSPWEYRVCELQDIRTAHGEDVDLLQQGARNSGGTYSYVEYSLHRPDDVTPHVRTDADAHYRDYFLRPEVPYELKRLDVPTVCAHFADRADTLSQLSMVFERFSSWTNRILSPSEEADKPEKIPQTNVNSTISRILVRALELGAFTGEDDSLVRTLDVTGMSPGGRAALSNAVTVAMTALLGHRDPSVTHGRPIAPRERLERINRGDVVQATAILDGLGALSERFWAQYALAISRSTPEFSQLLIDKLQTPEGATIARNNLGDPQGVVTNYIYELFKTLSNDPTRNGARIEQIIANASPKSAKLRFSLSALVTYSNDIVDQVNKAREARRKAAGLETPVELIGKLRPDDLGSVSDALLRLLQLTLRRDTTDEVRGRQSDHNMLYAGVVSELCELAKDDMRRIALGAIALRFPDATRSQLAAAEDLLRLGATMEQIVDALRP